jgi:hypothetical protein
LTPATSGNASGQITAEMTHITAILSNCRVRVVFIAVDGDAGYNSLFEKQFAIWYPIFVSSGMMTASRRIAAFIPWYVSDFLHLFKNVRNRLMRYTPIIQFEDLMLDVSVARIQSNFQLGAV